MRKNILLLLFCAFSLIKAQDYSSYNPSTAIINSLVHTKLKVSFDIPSERMFGEAWLTLQPHFYSTDSLTLDAKGMEIEAVTLSNNKSLKYNYANDQIKIALDKIYKKGESYTVYIKYTAIPANVKQKGSEAISDAKGLYFINPRGEEKNKPTQIWTQSATEAGSCWFPTIDKPNQKTSQEIYITVQDKYTTLSNGSLVSQTKNPEGTRTDYWKFDKKHAPYLLFIGIGEYAIVKDKWKNIPVDYYVEKEYEPHAKQIFGDTPAMMTFFSDLLNYPYPWEKYSQITGRDYISGAMENTTAVLHKEDAQQKPGQLIDENGWESVIAHELFHHWFGDLVTTESWANLTVNESMADYSEYLWFEHKYGKDKANELHQRYKAAYLGDKENITKNLVRFHYHDKEDMFDQVTYQKGGLILHMLRDYLGDDAFFAGLSKYLYDNAYKTGEAHQLRMALEEVSGRDLNWFFNQWYFGSGHPVLKLFYAYDSSKKVVKVEVIQSQNNKFEFPLDIDIYENGKPYRHKVWVSGKENNVFELPYKIQPQLVNINPDNILLSEITEDKTIEQYIFQYKNAAEYSSRRIALEKLAEEQKNSQALETLLYAAANDKYEGLRTFAISKLDIKNSVVKEKSAPVLQKIATSDSKTLVQAESLKQLAKIDAAKYASLFKEKSTNESFSIKAASIEGILLTDKAEATTIAQGINESNPGEVLGVALSKVAVANKDMSKLDLISKNIINLLFSSESQEDFNNTFEIVGLIMQGDYYTETKNIADFIVQVYPYAKQYESGSFLKQLLGQGVEVKQKALDNDNTNESLKKQVEYLQESIKKLK